MNFAKNGINLNILSKYRTEIYGFSIIWIMLFHGTICEIHWPSAFRILNIGNMGVESFLFLSGIGLYYSFVKNNDLRYYTKRRLLRIIIPLFTACGTYWIIQLLIGELSLWELISRILTLDFWITGNQQIWFISFLLIAYLLYPYFFSIIFKEAYDFRRELSRTLLLVMLCVIITIVLSIEATIFYDKVEIALTRFPVFIFGCLAGKYVFKEYQIKSTLLIPSILLIGGVFIAIVLDVCSGMPKRYLYLFAGIPLTLVLAWLLDILTWDKLHKTLIFFGEMSLELYLTHIIFINLYKDNVKVYEDGNIINYLGVLIISIIGAAILRKINVRINTLITV